VPITVQDQLSVGKATARSGGVFSLKPPSVAVSSGKGIRYKDTHETQFLNLPIKEDRNPE